MPGSRHSGIDVSANKTTLGLALTPDEVIWSANYQSFPDGRVFAMPKAGGQRRILSHTGLFGNVRVVAGNAYSKWGGEERAGDPIEIVRVSAKARTPNANHASAQPKWDSR